MCAVVAYAIFWLSFGFVFYVYGGYPLLLRLWSWLSARPVRKSAFEPRVSIVIAAHNERENIVRRIRNCLELDYPREKLEVVVSLDGPSDGTDELAEAFAREITIVRSTRREGKPAAINRAVPHTTGEILLFGDARQTFAPDAVRELVANFSDPGVGVVSGELMILDGAGKEASDGAGLYWRYEKSLRLMESSIHSVLGATGAIYAIRRNLFRPLQPDTLLDDVAIPMGAVLSGYRSVLEPRARAYDRSAPPEVEYRRKVRTLTGNYQLVSRVPDLLVPWRNPVFFQFVSHKIGRLVAPYFLVALFISNVFLLHGFYLITFGLQAAWYLLVLAGVAVSMRARVARTAWNAKEA